MVVVEDVQGVDDVAPEHLLDVNVACVLVDKSLKICGRAVAAMLVVIAGGKLARGLPGLLHQQR